MTLRTPKEIGHVIPLSGVTTGFTVCVTRYPNGRKLPAPRTILDTSGPKPKPFASVLAALDALAMWKAGPRAIKQLRPTDSVDLAVPAPAPKATYRIARESERPAVDAAPTETSGNLTKSKKLSPAARKRREARVARAKAQSAAKPALPEIVKLMPACPTQIIRDRRTKTQALLAMLEATGQAKVVTYQESTRRNYVPKHGGVLPAHLNPVVMA